MRQVWFLFLVCGFFSATSLSAEEARRAELVTPSKKSAPEEPQRALPVTPADKKETVAASKKEKPSIEIDLGAKKETAQVAKKEATTGEKKETTAVAKKDAPQVEKKPIASVDKKELTAPAKKEAIAVAKKEANTKEKRETNSVAKKDPTEIEKKSLVSVDKKEVNAPARKEVIPAVKKEAGVADKKEIVPVAKKEVAQVEKKEVPATKELAAADRKDVSSKTKKEFTFQDEKGKTVSAEVVDQYQSKRIVYPLAKVDHRVNARLIRAASIAQDRARAHSKSACWHYVKNALLASGIISTYPKSVYAKQAGDELVRDYGFKKLPIHDPYKAPIGSVLVYGARKAAGHVELRTKTGFVSDFQNKKPSKRPLIGVYAKA